MSNSWCKVCIISHIREWDNYILRQFLSLATNQNRWIALKKKKERKKQNKWGMKIHTIYFRLSILIKQKSKCTPSKSHEVFGKY